MYVRYEDLVSCPEEKLRQVLEFLDLPYEPDVIVGRGNAEGFPSWETLPHSLVQQSHRARRADPGIPGLGVAFLPDMRLDPRIARTSGSDRSHVGSAAG